MGKRKWYKCNCLSCFRAKLSVNDETPLQHLPKPKEADTTDNVPYIDAEKESDILIVRNVDLCISINGPLHNTSKYELMSRSVDQQLVIRRGQPFTLDIELNRPFNEIKDAISFVLNVEDEDKPSHGHGTLIAVPLLKRTDKIYPWNATLETINGNNITVQITSAPDCVVAIWRLEIDTKIITGGAYSYSCDKPIYILYNPWNKSDSVYMKSNEWREETVMCDDGLIWRGTSNRLRPTIWKYSQFEQHILECSMYLVSQVGKVRGSARGSPVLTVRALAAAVNSTDDGGVIMGNWSDDFSGGTAPTKWIGSMEILQKYYKKKKTVKFAQCWVFAGILTTICRALGIPSRVITNYSSAHDTQSSLTVDYFMDENGKTMDDLNSDSVWTFHVWNEVWMTRPDLSEDYHGWQVIDATPQELSEDLYRCGPASVVACKRGEILRPYDGPFLFAEVNADKVYWRYTGPNQPLKLLGKDADGIGKLISTKAPGKFDREDITSSYKHDEKTKEERATMLKALRQSKNLFARYYLNEDFSDVHFQFEFKDDVVIGRQFNVTLVMKNKNKVKDYNVTVVLRVEVITYTGKVGELIKKDKRIVTVKGGTVHDIKMNVIYEEYFDKLIDQCSFKVSCLATVEGTAFEYYVEEDFRLRKPDIKISLPETIVKKQTVVGDIELINPLPVPLKKCEFSVDAPGYHKPLKIKIKGTVLVGQTAVAQFKFTPQFSGTQTVAAKFISKQLNDVDGFLNFLVEPTKEETAPNN